ncbi:MAG TPA: hypothetical protein VKZ60_18445 [Chloroflexota bacterium]|jgi:hypothetical protein|nr:hypothetical protein [Chloroflexota bacterium]
MSSGQTGRGEASEQSGAGAPPAPETACALCRAPLPPGHRYLCAACVAASERVATAILARTTAPTIGPGDAAVPEPAASDEEPDTCPTCGMRLDPSGRCAGCVTTVRR